VVATSFLHLDQVLLARQSMAMAQEDDHLHSDQRSEREVRALELREREVSDVDSCLLSPWHGDSL
jgi:hypothetical protein